MGNRNDCEKQKRDFRGEISVAKFPLVPYTQQQYDFFYQELDVFGAVVPVRKKERAGFIVFPGRQNSSRETKFSGTHGDREIFIFFPLQLTTSRTGLETLPG